MYVPEKPCLIVIGEPPGWQDAQFGFCIEDFLNEELYHETTKPELLQRIGETHCHLEISAAYSSGAYRKLIERVIYHIWDGESVYCFCPTNDEAEQFFSEMRHEGIEHLQLAGRIVLATKGVVQFLEEAR